MKKTIKKQKAVLIILLSNVFIAFLGIGLIIPVMPSFMNIMHLSGKAMGYLFAAISTGFIIGPGIGGFIAEYGVRMPFFFAAAIAFLACISSIFILKDHFIRFTLLHLSLYLYSLSVYQHMKLFLAYFLIINSASHRRTLQPLLQ